MAANPIDPGEGDSTLDDSDKRAPPALPAATSRYLTRDRLGHGGMGEVLLVHDTLIGRDVAMKQLLKDTVKARRRFTREARVQGQLEHPAVAPVYDLSTDGAPYFTMKRVRGMSLRSALTSVAAGDGTAPARFSRRRLLAAFSQVCLAAHYAHERGILHRDIKPDNIMLGDYGEVYLLDWGIAKVTGDDEPLDESETQVHTRAGDLIGTVGYMAPEQAQSDLGTVDARTDVYALGAILFEILTLERLHQPAPWDTMVERIVAGVEARCSVRAPERDVPPELEAVCVAATRRYAAERLPSARALHDAIERYLDGDRDAELRRASARKHAEQAQHAAARVFAAPAVTDESARRGEALREVGKALALDPSNRDALETLVHLLTTPPRLVPTEVERERQQMLRLHVRRSALIGAFLFVYVLANAFFMYPGAIRSWSGLLPAQLLWAAAALAGGVTVLRPGYAGLFAMLVLGTAAGVESTRILSPLIIVPGIFAAFAAIYSLMTAARLRVAAVVLVSIGWTLSMFGERLGLFPRMVVAVSGGLFIDSPVVELARVFTAPMTWVVFLSLIVLPALLVGALRSQESKADLQLRLQSWQLRQLLPDPAAKRRD